MNYLISMSYEMGLPLDKNIKKYFPNATKCSTWHDVKTSHETKDMKVRIKLDDIYGMLMILALGLSGAILLLTLELMTNAMKVSMRAASTPGIGKTCCTKVQDYFGSIFISQS